MGRPRKSNPLNLPPRVYASHGQFYYEHPGTRRWEPLGTDVERAKKRAAEISRGAGDGFGTVAYWLDEFLADCRMRVAAKVLAPRTLADYGLELGRAVRANREKACLSSMFTWLIRKGHAGVKSNPCIGVRRNPERKRARYVDDAEMRATLAKAPVQVWALAELVYRTLQRPEDIITWTVRNIVERTTADGRAVKVIRNEQSKVTAGASKVVDIEVTPELAEILARLKVDSLSAKNKNLAAMTLLHRRDGKAYTYDGLCAMLKRRQAQVRAEHARAGGPLAAMASWGFYDMKGKGATDMWQAGVPLVEIQALCGHESVKTTERYVKDRWRGVIAPNKVARSA